MVGSHMKFQRLYDHLRTTHALTPLELELARTFTQLKAMHAAIAPRCEWRPR